MNQRSSYNPLIYNSLMMLLGGLLLSLGGVGTAFEPQVPTSGEEGFTPLFDGKTLAGWEGDLDLWQVRDKMIVGDSPGINRNEFLATKKQYGNFELRLEFRLHGGNGNSGIQFRSRRVPESRAVAGYQADIGENYWGNLYDEHRRRRTLVQAPAPLRRVLNPEGWNSYQIRAEGDRVRIKMNGLAIVDYREPEASVASDGIIALQIHGGEAMRVDFRNLRIKELVD